MDGNAVDARAPHLRQANRRLLGLLDRMAGDGGPCRVPAPEEIAALLSELMHTGADLRARSGASDEDAEFARELQEYRGHVERLREMLPTIHGQLLAERARIEAQRARIETAAEWARGSRQTL